MKKRTGLLLALLLAVALLLTLSLATSAESTTKQDGLKVSIATDKSEYSASEDITISIYIKDTVAQEIENVSYEIVLPRGLKLKSGNISETNITIEPGPSYTASIVARRSSFSIIGVIIIALLVIMLLAAVAVVVIILILKRKKAVPVLSVVLCLAMVFAMFPVGVFAAEDDSAAEDNATTTICVDKEITVGGKDYSVKLNVSYPSVEGSNQVVPAEIAALFGLDPNEYDSDSDGLSNYVEIFITGTDPTLKDTDENGILDADEDADGDGLSNIAELAARTNLARPDSDADGLSDYQELNETKTEPCNYDTDEDGLSDGDELELGLDPLKPKTDGTTLDSERKITQTLKAENMDELLTSENNDAVPSLTLTTNGNINNRVVITTTASNDFSDSRAIVGEAIDVDGDNLGKGTLSFALKKADSTASSGESGKTYNTKLICKYNGEGSTEYLDTTFDATENIVSAEVNSEGTYFVLDVANLFSELGLAMPTASKSGASTASAEASAMGGATFAVATPETTNTKTAETTARVSAGVMAQADIVFLIDTTGSMGSEISNVKNNVKAFLDALNKKGVDRKSVV